MTSCNLDILIDLRMKNETNNWICQLVIIMHVLGKNMAWLLKMKDATASRIEPPKKEKKEYTNFIRQQSQTHWFTGS